MGGAGGAASRVVGEDEEGPEGDVAGRRPSAVVLVVTRAEHSSESSDETGGSGGDELSRVRFGAGGTDAGGHGRVED